MFLNLRSDSSLIVSLSFVILTLLKSAGQWLCRQLFWLCLFLGLWVFDQNTTEVILHFSQCIQARSSGCWYDLLGMLTLLLGLCWVSFPWSTYFSGYYLNGCRAFYWDVYGNQILFLYILFVACFCLYCYKECCTDHSCRHVLFSTHPWLFC